MRLALTEASEGRIGTLADRLLLICYHYDPATGKYGVAIWNGVRVAIVAFAISLAFWIWRLKRRAAGKAQR